ncbi:hypothetical protein D1871_18030 [Nakamurella silvestris]|nr:hypothetical protein D1871_18030 [Nakamurella silvestris]
MAEIEHVANALCLELANSVNNRSAPTADWLADPAGYLAWVESLGLRPGPTPSQADLKVLVELREAVFRTFAAVAATAAPDQSDLDAITSVHAAGFAEHGLVHAEDGYRRNWPPTVSVGSLSAAAASSAVELLTGTAQERIKSCPSCEWLFLDISKNGTRRWCSMAMCGSRIKAKRHYDRARTATVTVP